VADGGVRENLDFTHRTTNDCFWRSEGGDPEIAPVMAGKHGASLAASPLEEALSFCNLAALANKARRSRAQVADARPALAFIATRSAWR